MLILEIIVGILGAVLVLCFLQEILTALLVLVAVGVLVLICAPSATRPTILMVGLLIAIYLWVTTVVQRQRAEREEAEAHKRAAQAAKEFERLGKQTRTD
jgi:L-asparagine transporter-like permease